MEPPLGVLEGWPRGVPETAAPKPGKPDIEFSNRFLKAMFLKSFV